MNRVAQMMNYQTLKMHKVWLLKIKEGHMMTGLPMMINRIFWPLFLEDDQY